MTLYMGAPSARPGGCEIYRGNLPMHFLKEEGHWDTAWEYFANVYGSFMKHGLGFLAELFKRYQIFIFPRMFIPAHQHDEVLAAILQYFDMIHSFGGLVVWETDDDYTNTHRQVIDGDIDSLLPFVDAVTVTTPQLRDLIGSLTDAPTYVLPNMLPPTWRQINNHERLSDKLVIGLSGSTTHYNDWLVLEPVVEHLLKDFGDQILFVCAGFLPDYLKDYDVTFIPGLPYDQYTELIKCFDIVLAPVDPQDQFNNYKSPIKALEGMGALRMVDGQRMGAAVIASDNSVYRLAIEQERNGLLVEHTSAAWYDAIAYLVTHRRERLQYQRNGYRWVWKNHDISKTWRLWQTAYRDAFMKKGN